MQLSRVAVRVSSRAGAVYSSGSRVRFASSSGKSKEQPKGKKAEPKSVFEEFGRTLSQESENPELKESFQAVTEHTDRAKENLKKLSENLSGLAGKGTEKIGETSQWVSGTFSGLKGKIFKQDPNAAADADGQQQEQRKEESKQEKPRQQQQEAAPRERARVFGRLESALDRVIGIFSDDGKASTTTAAAGADTPQQQATTAAHDTSTYDVAIRHKTQWEKMAEKAKKVPVLGKVLEAGGGSVNDIAENLGDRFFETETSIALSELISQYPGFSSLAFMDMVNREVKPIMEAWASGDTAALKQRFSKAALTEASHGFQKRKILTISEAQLEFAECTENGTEIVVVLSVQAEEETPVAPDDPKPAGPRFISHHMSLVYCMVDADPSAFFNTDTVEGDVYSRWRVRRFHAQALEALMF